MLATDPLSLVFIACFLFGLLFLIVAALLGSAGHHGSAHMGSTHHIDAGGHGAQAHTIHTGGHTHLIHPTTQTAHNASQGNSFLTYLNPTSIVLFLVGFGFFGYVFHNNTSLALPLSIALAAIGGLVVAALLLALIGRVFGDSEGETVQDVSDRTGLLGKVSLTIPENSLGEVIYVSPGGMRKSIPARTLDGRRLERDQEVVVVNYQRGIAEVDTWDHFVNQEESEATISGPEADGLAELRALLEQPDRLEQTDKTDNEYVMRKDSQKE